MSFCNEKEYTGVVNFLINNLLPKWHQSENIKNFSLPQGPIASLILADIYLYPVDRKMHQIGRVLFYRYMDDIRLFTKTKHDLKVALMELVKELRELKLNLNAKKTKIYETKHKESLKDIIDPQREVLNTIDTAFRSKKKDQIKLVISNLFEIYKFSLNSDNPFRERYFRFFVSRCIDLMRFDLIEKKEVKSIADNFIDLLEDKPHMTDKICWFLLAACCYDKQLKPNVLKKLINFVKDKTKNIYAWQEMVILDTIRQIIEKKDIMAFKNIRKLNVKHMISYAQKNLMLGKLANTDDMETIVNDIQRKKYEDEILRSSALAVQSVNKEIRDNLYDQYIEKSYIREYLKRVHSAKYYGYVYNLPKEETDEEPISTYYQ